MKNLVYIAFVAMMFMGRPQEVSAMNFCEDRPTTVGEMPVAARNFLSEHFAEEKVSIAMYEWEYLKKEYTVILASGSKIEFDSKGEWLKIDIKGGVVPSAIVPAPILEYIANHFSQQRIIEIERDSRKYDVELSGGFEVKFDKKFRVIGFDD